MPLSNGLVSFMFCFLPAAAGAIGLAVVLVLLICALLLLLAFMREAI